jgi:hypothetical protein
MNQFFRYHAWSGRTIGVISAVVAIIVWQLTAAFNKRFIAPVIDRRFSAKLITRRRFSRT